MEYFVNIINQEQSFVLLQFAYDNGYNWAWGIKEESEFIWNLHKEETVYIFDLSTKLIWLSNVEEVWENSDTPRIVGFYTAVLELKKDSINNLHCDTILSQEIKEVKQW